MDVMLEKPYKINIWVLVPKWGRGCHPRSCLSANEPFFGIDNSSRFPKRFLQQIIVFFISVVPTGGKGTWKGPKPKLNSKASQKTTLKWKRHGIICFQATSCCPRQPPLPSAALRRSRRTAAGEHLLWKYEKEKIENNIHSVFVTTLFQQAAYGLSPNIMQLAGLQGGTGNPLLDMYSQYAAAYSPQVGFPFNLLIPFLSSWLLWLTPPSLSKWCQQWPKPKHWPLPLSSSSSNPSSFPSPLSQVSTTSTTSSTHQPSSQQGQPLEPSPARNVETSFQKFQILSGQLLSSAATNNDTALAKSKQDENLPVSQFSDEISKRILSTLDYG